MATGQQVTPPRKYWVGVFLAAAFVLFGLLAVLGILARDPTETRAQLGFSPNLYFWLLLIPAIFGEIVGVVGLFLRRTWATLGFGLSVVFTVLYYSYVLPVTGWKGPLAGPIVITALHIVLLWFAVVANVRRREA